MTKILLDSGLCVIAVEPNEDMLKIAIDNLKGYRNFISVKGTAEDTSLETKSVDFIVAAQAFHWFDVLKFRKECKRILKTGGKAAIISNERVTEDIINKEIAAAYQKFCPNFIGFSNGLIDSIERYDSFYEKGYALKSYENPLTYDKNSFIGRHLSSSFALTEGDELYRKLVDSLANIFERHSRNGVLTLANMTKYWCGVLKNS